MPFATAHTIALQGALGHLIEVQVDVSPGMVSTTMVGRPDAALSEARDRVRMAIANSSPRWPSTKRVTILLSPADLPKRGTHFDVAIAVAVKAAAGQLPAATLQGTVFIGELTLSGGLRPVAGVLPMVLAAAERGIHRVFVPEPQAGEAAMVPGMTVFGVRSLAQVVAELCGEEVPEAPPVAASSSTRLVRWRGQDHLDEVDLADLKGMEEAKFAAEVAAAGGHHLLLSGPKGCGKTSLAERVPGLLPDLDREAALELTAIHSLAARPGEHVALAVRPPYSAPHHDASTASLLGGGTGCVRPGEVSKAHHGVLFLDEFPLFRADVIQALRQPMEGGEVTIARGEESATFPARGMLVLAANPCPCGNFHTDAGRDTCGCREVDRRAYRRKLEGPLMDRVDITCHVRGASETEMGDQHVPCESSAAVRLRVAAARAVQLERYAGRGWRLNGQAPGTALLESWPLAEGPRRVVEAAVGLGRLSRRGATRVHRLAWTVADLAGHEQPTADDTEAALALRLGEPLRLRALGWAG
jgi:magnesium chelatase family protein